MPARSPEGNYIRTFSRAGVVSSEVDIDPVGSILFWPAGSGYNDADPEINDADPDPGNKNSVKITRIHIFKKRS